MEHSPGAIQESPITANFLIKVPVEHSIYFLRPSIRIYDTLSQ